jgi:hypothetical protein
MPARLAPQGISTHPQLQKMIEAFIAGTPAREIARWATPRVAHNTISRYMRARVRPALNNAARLFAVDPPRTGAALGAEAKKKTRNVATQQTERPQMERDQAEQLALEALVAAPALSLFRQRLERLHDRVDRALDRAESAVRVIEKDGKMVAAGADLSPIAPLLSQAHRNLEMLGRATGELEPTGSASVQIQIICPAAGSSQAPRIVFGSDDGRMIDGSAIEVESEIGIQQRR